VKYTNSLEGQTVKGNRPELRYLIIHTLGCLIP